MPTEPNSFVDLISAIAPVTGTFLTTIGEKIADLQCKYSSNGLLWSKCQSATVKRSANCWNWLKSALLKKNKKQMADFWQKKFNFNKEKE